MSRADWLQGLRSQLRIPPRSRAGVRARIPASRPASLEDLEGRVLLSVTANSDGYSVIHDRTLTTNSPGVLGNDRLRTFPVWEMDFGTLPEVREGIATRRVKWDRKYQKKHGIRTGLAQGLPDGCAAHLDRLSKRIYRSLSLSGYARLDYRLRADGSVFVLEANANPNISHKEDFADSALNAGIGYPDLLQKLIALGRGYRAKWRDD